MKEEKTSMSAQMSRKHREKLTAQGLCIQCAVYPAASGHKLCADCLSRHAERSKAVYWERRVKGLCVQCGKAPARPGKVKCVKCAMR